MFQPTNNPNMEKRMDDRIYFAIGDLIANVTVGAIIGVVSWLIVGNTWNMLLSMALMMVVGMVLALPLAFLFVAVCGAMEVLVPVLLTGMSSGMVVGVWNTVQDLSLLEALLVGSACGVMSIVMIWAVNSRIKGIQELD